MTEKIRERVVSVPFQLWQLLETIGGGSRITLEDGSEFDGGVKYHGIWYILEARNDTPKGERWFQEMPTLHYAMVTEKKWNPEGFGQ